MPTVLDELLVETRVSLAGLQSGLGLEALAFGFLDGEMGEMGSSCLPAGSHSIHHHNQQDNHGNRNVHRAP